MKKTLTLFVCAVLLLSLLTGCGGAKDKKRESINYETVEAIMKNVCKVNNIPYLNETLDKNLEDKGIYEIILCGVVTSEKGLAGIMLVPDNRYFKDYNFPWGEDGQVRFDSKIMFDERGNMYDYDFEDDLIGRHIIIICLNQVSVTYPGQLIGQRVTVILDD